MPTAQVDLSEDGTATEPINREPEMATLISSFLTEQDHYDRNHGAIQHKNAANHIVTVDGLVSKSLKLTIPQLTTDFAQHSVVCALQCAGNRRHTMRTRIQEVQGVDWFDAAIMNVKFSGPKVRDVLLAAGVKEGEGSNFVQFANYGSKTQEDDWYGGSIPFQRAMDSSMDVVLALQVRLAPRTVSHSLLNRSLSRLGYLCKHNQGAVIVMYNPGCQSLIETQMNDKIIPHRHGYPVRAIVPGVLGARSVKWLDRITVSDQESPCFYQNHDYKILPPEAVDKESAEKFWDKVPPMLDMPVNASVAIPASETTVQLPTSGMLDVRGYAVPHGSEGPVVRVQVSGDEGVTWIDAEVDNGGDNASKWSWVLWRAQVRMTKGKDKKIFAKATDAGGNTQSAERSQWNLRGVAYNGYEAAYGLTII